MTTKWMPLMGTGLAVRMDLLDERQAQINHGQSLDKLADRGGLGPDEALDLAARREWVRGRHDLECFTALARMVSNVQVEGAAGGLPPEAPSRTQG